MQGGATLCACDFTALLPQCMTCVAMADQGIVLERRPERLVRCFSCGRWCHTSHTVGVQQFLQAHAAVVAASPLAVGAGGV